MVKKAYTTQRLVKVLLLLAVTLPLWLGVAFPGALRGGVAVPALLSLQDKKLYQDIFQAQKSAEWGKADLAIGQLADPMLMGHVLAERYLDKHYQPTSQQLSAWLDRYSDLPQAHAIYDLARSKSASAVQYLEKINKPAALSGYGDSHASAAEQSETWKSGIHAWKAGNKAAAAKIFTALANNKSLSSWQSSAASFWAYRSLSAAGNKAAAQAYLQRAAKDNRSFYGILARKQLNLPITADSGSLVSLSTQDILDMASEPRIHRAIALSQAGATDMAERELRVVFPQADEETKLRLLALAHDLKLASVQISMAKTLNRNGHDVDSALYPVPRWKPHNGFKVDPALVYAMARQESGFHVSAVSPNGAQGIMQLMPKTASMMKKEMGLADAANHINDPAFNITLGQNYIKHLLDHPMVDGNMVYMLVAYNAGAGRLQEWKETAATDPLLFIESIPFGETRAYVTQVMAGYWVYSELAGSPSETVLAMTQGQWPSYESMSPLASLLSTSFFNG